MTWPDPVLLSIYKAFPRRTGRQTALTKIAEALDRIVAGEIDGQPRTSEEAVAFLRERVDAMRIEMAGREKKFIPHPSTWLHQSRYLRTTVALALPKRLTVCAEILALYPKMPEREHIERNVETFLPHLNAIEKLIDGQPARFVEHLAERTALFAFYVAKWPAEEERFIPGAKRFYDERRFEKDERTWQRNSPVGFEQERDQVRRLIGN